MSVSFSHSIVYGVEVELRNVLIMPIPETCGHQYSRHDNFCPRCGKPVPKRLGAFDLFGVEFNEFHSGGLNPELSLFCDYEQLWSYNRLTPNLDCKAVLGFSISTVHNEAGHIAVPTISPSEPVLEGYRSLIREHAYAFIDPTVATTALAEFGFFSYINISC